MCLKRVLLSLLRHLAALLTLPFCVGFSTAVLCFLQGSADLLEFWAAFGGGAALWLVTFALLPKPLWIYVLGHEATHALWTWLCGGRVKSFKVSGRGGHVNVSKTNALITLAPYFFPLYSLLWELLFWLGRWRWQWEPNSPVHHLGLGLTYAFHLTLTAYVLRIRQPDIVQEGAWFSAVSIGLGNVTVLLLALPPLVSAGTPLTGLSSGWEETGRWLDLLVRRLG